MRLGMFMQPVHDPKRDYTQALKDDQETIILADKLGFHEVWVGEHVSATAEPITAPLVFLATLIDKTENNSIPLYHYRAAQNWYSGGDNYSHSHHIGSGFVLAFSRRWPWTLKRQELG